MKPLGGKSYGSIPHLPDSRMGPADHHCSPGQATIATERIRDRHDIVIVQEKLDGSCCSVAILNDGSIVALSRAGYLAETSKYEQHHLFAAWVRENEDRLRAGIVHTGRRLVGEWLAQAHGTRYLLRHDPFVPFDLMDDSGRLGYAETQRAALRAELQTPALIGLGPTSVASAMERIWRLGHHGAIDGVEGAVWRVEREGVVDFVVKYVRPDKQDGTYLPEVSGGPAWWNWRPKEV